MSKNKPNFTRNAITYFFEYIVTAGINFAVVIVAARHYGATIFGDYSLIQSITQLATPLLAVSGELVTIRELVRYADKHNLIMGTAFAFFATTTILAAAALFMTFTLFYPSNGLMGVAFIAALTFSPFTVIEHFFKSEGAPYRTLAAKTTALTAGFIAKNLVMVLGGAISSVVIVTVGETLLTAIILLWFYKKNGHKITHWKFKMSLFFEFFKFFLPTIISGFIVSMFFRVTHIMTSSLASHHDLGLYALSFQVTQSFLLLPQILISTFYPFLVSTHQNDKDHYNKLCRLLFSVFSLIGFGIVFSMWAFGSDLFQYIAGEKYNGISPILTILSISIIFNFSAAGRNQTLFIENTQFYTMINAGVGLAILIPANYFLIPAYGALGSAMALSLASSVSGVLTSFAFPRSRQIGWEQIRALMILPAIITVMSFRSILATRTADAAVESSAS